MSFHFFGLVVIPNGLSAEHRKQPAASRPRIMKTGSMRIEPNAMCELETHTGAEPGKQIVWA